ncbi:proline-rich protein 12 isoform X1 [Nothobranchius furzeri]|uniref:proline-rich protein 12 isoform X1 n=1 Tax=Nothobranchius furzeri TaxID=105023 RepID=UPI0039046477
MDRNYPAAGFGDLGAGTGWVYDRSAKASFMYGSSRSTHPDSELLHRQAYSTPHPLQGYATNHPPGSSRQGGAWGPAGRTLGLSGLFDTSLHHAGPTGPDPSVMNLISALESRGPQPTASASSLLSQFRTPSWQTAMHTPAPAELFISGAIPGSGSFPSSSPISAYQHPGSFNGRSFAPSLSIQESSTFSPTSNGLLSPHDSLLHIKAPSQSSLGFDRLLSSHSSTYRGSQEPPAPSQTQASSTSSSCHLPHPQFNVLSSQLHNRSSQLYNNSMFPSAPSMVSAATPLALPPPERAASRQDSVIKHYQRSPPAQSTTLQQYASCGESSGFQQIVSHHRQAGLSQSPLGEQSPPSDPKPSLQTYQPIVQTPYTPSSSSASSSSATKELKGSNNSTSGYSSSSSASSSSRNPQTPPSASSASSSNSSVSKTSSSSLLALSHQQPQLQPAPAPTPLPAVSSSFVQQPVAKQCLSNYGSQSLAKSSTDLSDQPPPQLQSQFYSAGHPPLAHMAQPLGGFGSPNAQDLSSEVVLSGGKAFTGVGSGGRAFSAETVFEESSFSSGSLRGASSPSMGFRSESTRSGPLGVTSHGGVAGSAASGSEAAGVGIDNTSSYHLPESSTSPSDSSSLTHPALQSPVNTHLAQSPGASGATKYLSSMLSPAFMPSPQALPDLRRSQSQSYHATLTRPKAETSLLTAERSRHDDEDADDFLIQHLLHSETSASHHSQHPAQQLTRSVSRDREGEGKGMTYNMSKLSDEHYHPQSVIRTRTTTSSSAPAAAGADTTSGSSRQLERAQNKQQAKSEMAMSKSPAGARRAAESLSHTQSTVSLQQQHESLGSAVHFGRGGPYAQQALSQHQPHTSHALSHSQQHPHHPQHPQLSHPPSYSHMELKKPANPGDSRYLCDTPDVQQSQSSQAPLSLMDSSPDLPQSTHMSVLSQNTHTKMDHQQALKQQHSLSQPGMMGVGSGGVESQLQNQNADAHYSHADQTQASQNSMSPLDILDPSLSQANSLESRGPLDRAGVGGAVPLGEGADRHRQQHRLTPHHHPQQNGSDVHAFLADPDLGVSPSSHLHHLNQPPAHAHSHALHDQQTHTHHRQQLTHPHSRHMAANLGTPQQSQQSQTRESELTHPQLDQLKQHHYSTMSPADKAGQNQVQPQQRFPSLTSVCFPDSLLQDEDRSFFPEMEDMFSSSDYKSGCGADSAAQEDLSRSHVPAQEAIETLKAGGAGGGYNIMGHTGDQGYGQYCHSLPGAGDGNLHLDHDPLKTHELPSTVNTDQLGLIQSQTLTLGLGSAVPGDGSVNKMVGSVGGSSNTSGLTSPIFCSSRPKKLLKTSSFHLLKQRREPQPPTKKNYAQEYEFEDDEDKADAPADIRLNSRRHPALLPDLVSSCRRAAGTSGVSRVSPIMVDMDFCHPSSYSPLGHPSQNLTHNGPKKRGRKPTKPKREGPPRPRGRPRIRPLPEPPYCRGLMGSAAGESRRGRGRGRGRGRREDGLVETHRDLKTLSYSYQQQPYNQQQHLQQHPPQHYSQQPDLHQAPHQQPQHHLHLHQHQQVSSSHHQLHHQQHYQHPQQQPSQQALQDAVRPVKIELPTSSRTPTESLLRTDSLSSSDPVLSDGSVGSAPSLGLSPGSGTTMDVSRTDLDQTQDKMVKHQQRADEMLMEQWTKEPDDPLDPGSWASVQKLSNPADDRAFDFKPAFAASFLDFLKASKKGSELDLRNDGVEQELLDTCSSLKEGIQPLSPPPPSPSQQPPETFSDGGQGEGADLALSNCPSPCKPLDEELKRNLETLPSFSSDEEDSVSKNQDLQKSISSAISALYDTPHSLAAAMASAMMKVQPTLSTSTPPEPSLSPPLPATPHLILTMENTKEEARTYTQRQMEEGKEQSLIEPTEDGESDKDEMEVEMEGGEEPGKNKDIMQVSQTVQKELMEENRVSEMQVQELPKAEEAVRADFLPDLTRERLGIPPEELAQVAGEREVWASRRYCPRNPTPDKRMKMDGWTNNRFTYSPSEPALAPPSPSLSVPPSPHTHSSPSPLPPESPFVPCLPLVQPTEAEMSLLYPASEPQQSSHQQTAGSSPPPSTSPPATLSSPLSNLPLSHSIPPPSTTPPPSSSDQDQEPDMGQPSSSSSSSSSPSSSPPQPPSPPTPEEAPASQRLTSLHLAKKQTDAAIVGESEEEDSESGGEGIFRERDEFVVRTEDIGTLKMALQTGREPPPIWRVQKALLQKFSPEIKDGQRQFCATSNYLGYFGDAKMRYQRLYVKFLENVNKKDYVRVCSRKPWHRAGLTLRRQSMAKQLLNVHNQSQTRMDRNDKDKERQKERELKEHRAREKEREKQEKDQKEREKQDREQKEKMTKDKEEREQKERDCRETEAEIEKEQKEQGQREKEQKEKERIYKQQREKEQGEREKTERALKEKEKQEIEQKYKEKKEKEKRDKEQNERRQEKEQREKEKQGKETREKLEKVKQEQERREKQIELKEKERKDTAKEKTERERRNGNPELVRLKEVKRGGENKMECQSRTKMPKDRSEPPPKKRKKWLKEVPSSSNSSESESSLLSDDEGPVRALMNSRAMWEMFRSYVEMLVSTALDPDMIQALEDTDDELYLPPMRKIDGLLSEEKKRLLRRINMSSQHQEALHLFPIMTADPLESGAVRVHLGGEGYNRKTLNRIKKSILKQQDLKLPIETCRLYSLYHSLHHYKYHTFLHCKKETDNIEQAAEDPGQEEVVQQCMANQGWLENLFNSFMELFSLSAKA